MEIVLEEVGELLFSTSVDGCVGKVRRKTYSRKELEALRFLDVDAQQRKWQIVCTGLEAIVAYEYNGLRVSNDQEMGNKGNILWNKFAGKKDDLGAVGDVLSGIFISSDVAYGETLAGSETYTDNEVSYFENHDNENIVIDAEDNDSSDDEYDSSIQRLAFLVKGEPDFDSGPPLDGLEYLRRVRWEAAQIPKVKVAQLNFSDAIREQTLYMPSIPDIAECPPNLLPVKHWKDAFLADFSKLRQELSKLENGGKQSACRQKPKGDPTVSAILSMDVASRAFLLRSSISSLEGSIALSRADCLWLFTFLAAVDAPLDADTCASIRCLLRKCSTLLTAKSALDDEVAMLNILIAIAGKYFGQSENRFVN